MDWEIGNYGYGAAPGHPFLEAVIENCIRAQRDRKWIEPMMRGIPRLFRTAFIVLNSTGPGLLSRTLAENANLAPQVKILFPEDVCDSSNWHNFGGLGVHLMAGSWRRQSGGFLFRRLANLWESRARHSLLRQSLSLGRTRCFRGPVDTSQTLCETNAS